MRKNQSDMARRFLKDTDLEKLFALQKLIEKKPYRLCRSGIPDR